MTDPRIYQTDDNVPQMNYCEECREYYSLYLQNCPTCLEENYTKEIGIAFIDQEDLIFDFEETLDFNHQYDNPDDLLEHIKSTDTFDDELKTFCIEHKDFDAEFRWLTEFVQPKKMY